MTRDDSTGQQPSNSIDVSGASGLKQATYVLKFLCEGENETQIADRFNGDLQLVRMWKCFLTHNRWMEKDIESKRTGILEEHWRATAKGTIFLNRYITLKQRLGPVHWYCDTVNHLLEQFSTHNKFSQLAYKNWLWHKEGADHSKP